MANTATRFPTMHSDPCFQIRTGQSKPGTNALGWSKRSIRSGKNADSDERLHKPAQPGGSDVERYADNWPQDL
jgi:hypothetical protein